MLIDDAPDEVFAVDKLREALAELGQHGRVVAIAFNRRKQHLTYNQARALMDSAINLQGAIRQYIDWLEEIGANDEPADKLVLTRRTEQLLLRDDEFEEPPPLWFLEQ